VVAVSLKKKTALPQRTRPLKAADASGRQVFPARQGPPSDVGPDRIRTTGKHGSLIVT